jgi:hypothetical protein
VYEPGQAILRSGHILSDVGYVLFKHIEYFCSFFLSALDVEIGAPAETSLLTF